MVDFSLYPFCGNTEPRFHLELCSSLFSRVESIRTAVLKFNPFFKPSLFFDRSKFLIVKCKNLKASIIRDLELSQELRLLSQSDLLDQTLTKSE